MIVIISQHRDSKQVLRAVLITLAITIPAALLLHEVTVVSQAYAEVADMDYRDSRRDRDFKKAVKYIIENCTV
ncbi:hypothetical protein DC094_16040 [Pelagibaculum spongiae]|uniref:Uncharacterized protein n=1 Tax=Pelagibaculum spongiae TaxID=2080658 RepID=A0A2V1GYD5_9GAMM|nr:hypothetical protein DC094_16040 [Pelagibaculum spongiae]